MNWRNIIGWLAAAILSLLSAAAAQAQAADSGALHITCDDVSVGAVVSINGQAKGECPFDIIVPAGTIALRAVKPVGELRESVFEQSYLIGAGIRKPIEIILSAPQLTERGRALKEQAEKEAAEAKRQAAAAAQAAADAKAAAEKLAQEAAIARADPIADALIQARRTRSGTASSACPDCPGLLDNAAMSTDMPGAGDPVVSGWISEIQQDILRYARGDASFRLPSTQQSLPCEAALASFRKAADIVDFTARSETEKASWITHNGDVSPRIYYRDIRLWPVSGACKDGNLDGVAEAWISANAVIGMPTAGTLMTYPIMIKVKATFSGGSVWGDITRFVRVGATVYSDGVARPDSFDRAYFVRRDDGRDGEAYAEAMATLNRPTDNAEKNKFQAIQSTFVSTDANGKGRVDAFYGKVRANKYGLKNGLLHGWQVNSTSEYKSLAGKTWSWNGQSYCYQNDKLIAGVTECPD